MYHINALVTNLLQLINQVVEPDQGMTVWDILAYYRLSWANIVSFDKSIREVLAGTPPVSSDLVFSVVLFHVISSSSLDEQAHWFYFIIIN